MAINARSILNLDTISKGNNKPWDKLIAFMDEQPADMPLEFDFRGIEVIQPCSSDSFMKLIGDKRFHMTVYNSESTVKSVKLMCTLNGQDPDRIKNVKDEMPKVLTAEEKSVMRMAEQLQPYFETNDAKTSCVLHVYRRFDQIGSPNTVKYIDAAIHKYIENTDIKEIKVYLQMMSVQPSVVDAMVKMIEDGNKEGIYITLCSDDKETQDKLDMSQDLCKANYSISEKFQIMKSRLTMNRVGLLTRYRAGKAKDQFGRQGRGEVATVRVSLFRGFVNKDGRVLAKFRTFNSDYFYTRDHWYLEHDGEVINEPKCDDIYVGIDELGIYNDFIGTKYHFSTAVQYGKGGEVTMYSTSDNGGVIGTVMTIPERAKAVFDDFNIKYDAESLESYIEETKRILSDN